MPLPELAKSWQFDVNRVVTYQNDELALLQGLVRGVKDSLVTRLGSRLEVTSPWLVTQSSDSINVLESDLWVSDQALVWGPDSTPHSWIVLAQPGITSTSQICIDLLNEGDLSFVWAPNGFGSNGTTSSRPTAAAEIPLASSGGGGGGGGGGGPSSDIIFHAMQSTDGQCTRVVAYTQGIPILFMLFDRARNPVANWDLPVTLMVLLAESSGALSYSTLQSEAKLRGYGTAPMDLFMSTESFGSTIGAIGATLNGPNAFDGNWPLTPIGLASLTSGHAGRHGELFDLWFASTFANDGDTYPGDATRQFVQFGHLVFPWDGTPEQPGSIPRIT